MSPNRRTFLRSMAEIAAAYSVTALFPVAAMDQLAIVAGKKLNGHDVTTDEDFWSWVREQYTVSPNVLNLNNGGVSPQPTTVQDALDKYVRMCNEGPSYYMWRILDQGREPLRANLAELAGCNAEEVAINRNSTEALNTIIFGLNLKAGDEVVLSKQDYPNMLNAWKQRSLRDGVKLVFADHQLPSENENALVEAYTSLFTDRTKVVHVTHMINWTGQLLPVKKIADEAHERGIEVLVDGAHTFAHIDYNIPDLGADYFGASLHKWLCAPFGSGLLYIKKEKIKNIWPLLSNDNPNSADIRKFESLGTRSFPSEMAIGHALDFHNIIGTKRKEERLRYLKNYWAEKALSIDKFKLHTSLKMEFSCALSLFSIDGMKPEDVDQALFTKHKIHTVAINWESVHGVRVTPHVYTSTKDLDRLVHAISEIAKT